MKIALVSEIQNPILPDFPGGVEVFNYNLAEALMRKGHEVVVYASGDSKVNAKLFTVCPKALFHLNLDVNLSTNMRKIIYLENKYFIHAFENISRNHFDIIHQSHASFLPIYLGYKLNIPQILTTHFVKEAVTDMNSSLQEIFPGQKEIPLVSISKKQIKLLDKLSFFDTVYNGINLKDFNFQPKPNDYFVWLGRINANKGVEEAIQVAIEAKIQLKLAGGAGIGKIAQDYFNKLQSKYFHLKNIRYLGPADKKLRQEILSRAKAFISPINWEEPFGLVAIESMACGTPVVTFNRGAMQEIIKDGVTGFICPPGDIGAMVRAVKKIYEMPEAEYQRMRQNCRERVEQNFTVEKMVSGYEKVYTKVIESWKSKYV